VTERRPGQWPVDKAACLDTLSSAESTAEELYVRRAQEKALHEMVLDSIRHDLEQQPTGPSAQAKARIWCAHVLAIADDVARSKRETA